MYGFYVCNIIKYKLEKVEDSSRKTYTNRAGSRERFRRNAIAGIFLLGI